LSSLPAAVATVRGGVAQVLLNGPEGILPKGGVLHHQGHLRRLPLHQPLPRRNRPELRLRPRCSLLGIGYCCVGSGSSGGGIQEGISQGVEAVDPVLLVLLAPEPERRKH
jgi:hypothetical protein